jgi:uncharacterized protein (UPF0335 family)
MTSAVKAQPSATSQLKHLLSYLNKTLAASLGITPGAISQWTRVPIEQRVHDIARMAYDGLIFRVRFVLNSLGRTFSRATASQRGKPMTNETNGQLRAIVERIEHLDAEIAIMNGDKADIYKEAKSNGFDVKVLRALIAERRKDPASVQEMDALLDLYRAAVADPSRMHVHEANQ